MTQRIRIVIERGKGDFFDPIGQPRRGQWRRRRQRLIGRTKIRKARCVGGIKPLEQAMFRTDRLEQMGATGDDFRRAQKQDAAGA